MKATVTSQVRGTAARKPQGAGQGLEASVTHAYFGEIKDGKFVRTGNALCGEWEPDMPEILNENPPANVCPICMALYTYRSEAGM